MDYPEHYDCYIGVFDYINIMYSVQIQRFVFLFLLINKIS